MIFLALLAAQATDVAGTKSQLDAILASSERVSNQAFECMDANIKIALKAHLADATPETVVDSALAACSYLKKTYAEATVSPGQYISGDKSVELADNWFNDLRAAYLKHVDASLAKPELSKPRLNITLMLWRKCVQDKAISWSRLTDDAVVVGKAAVTSCNANRSNVQNALTYDLRGAGLPTSGSTQMLEKFDSTMVDVATEVVISERAKRLPKRRQ